MLQRVWGQLSAVGLQQNSIICASHTQVEIIRSQVRGARIAVEPARRDTFPAIALSCVYLKEKLGVSLDETVCVLPVDPYTEIGYFKTLMTLPSIIETSGADVALMGVKPTEPTSKFGYIIPAEDMGTYSTVGSFKEKPTEAVAKRLIEKGALWNCGVFCFKIREIINRLRGYGVPIDYDGLYANYERLPKISFDYEVVEKAHKLAVAGFCGFWKDLGTWDALTKEMEETTVGNSTVAASCGDTCVINELDIPVLAVGTKNLIVIASYDGILVADKEQTAKIKDLVDAPTRPPMFEEYRWGIIKVLDYCQSGNNMVNITRKVEMFANRNLSYHLHNHKDEIWTILSGKALFLVDGKRRKVWKGDSIHITRGTKHALLALTDLVMLEIQVGEKVEETDIKILESDWHERIAPSLP